ncbi:hypothetical protein [Streptomyces sp. NPDC058247]|uniref:hypothetical protein n=1 Tax=Streptomyces sp. NPDC058247 TaxID=3346401 RepID=UPI0036E1D6BD
MRLRSVPAFTVVSLCAGVVPASPAAAAASGAYSISPAGISRQCLYGQSIEVEQGVAPVGIAPCDYTADGYAMKWDVVTVPGRTGHLLRGAGTDNCITYDPSAQADRAQFKPCDGSSSASRWIATMDNPATVQFKAVDDPTKCLSQSGPTAKVLPCPP